MAWFYVVETIWRKTYNPDHTLCRLAAAVPPARPAIQAFMRSLWHDKGVDIRKTCTYLTYLRNCNIIIDIVATYVRYGYATECELLTREGRTIAVKLPPMLMIDMIETYKQFKK